MPTERLTRNGLTAVVSSDPSYNVLYPIKGYIVLSSGEKAHCLWTADGKYIRNGNSILDLI
jgi:hypothetical protein